MGGLSEEEYQEVYQTTGIDVDDRQAFITVLSKVTEQGGLSNKVLLAPLPPTQLLQTRFLISDTSRKRKRAVFISEVLLVFPVFTIILSQVKFGITRFSSACLQESAKDKLCTSRQLNNTFRTFWTLFNSQRVVPFMDVISMLHK